MTKKVRWVYSLKGIRNISQRCPVVSNDTVLAVFNFRVADNFKGRLVAIDKLNGTERWHVEAEHIFTEPVVFQQSIYISCFDGSIRRISKDGDIEWTCKPRDSNVGAGIILNHKFVYAEIAGQAGYTRAIDIETGAVAWEYENGGHSYALTQASIDSVIHTTIISKGFGQDEAYLNLLDTGNGRKKWVAKHDKYLFEPIVSGNTVLVGGHGQIAAFSVQDGKLQSTKQIEGDVSLNKSSMINNDLCLFYSESGQLYAVSPAEGKGGLFQKNKTGIITKWSLHLSSKISSQLIKSGNHLFILTDDGFLHKYDLADGKEIDSQKVSSPGNHFGIVLDGKDVIIATSRECLRVEIQI